MEQLATGNHAVRTILVTGGAGFIGSNFIEYMLKKYKGYRLINLDKLTYAGNLENLESIKGHPGYLFIHGDICDEELMDEIFCQADIDYVVNFAAESHVDRSILSPDVFMQTNVMGTAKLLHAAKRSWSSRSSKNGEELFAGEHKFLHVSTDEVYGSLGKSGFFTEETPLNPHSPYSASKAGADMLVKAYYDTYQMPINITRCSNNYGPCQFPEKLIPLVVSNAIAKKPLPVYGDGLNVRDWLYVEDHCSALDLVLHKGVPGEVYNIGGNNEKTNLEIVESIIDYLKEKVDGSIDQSLIKFVEDRKGHDRRYAIDAGKIKKELGWTPKTSFEEGIKSTVQWYVDHSEWVRSVTSGEYQKYYHQVYERNVG